MKLIPIVVLVSEDALHNLNNYTTSWMAGIPPGAYDSLLNGSNGWTPEMLIGGQLLTEGLSGATP